MEEAWLLFHLSSGLWDLDFFFLEEEQVGRRHGYSLQIAKELPPGVWDWGTTLGNVIRKVDDRIPWGQGQLSRQSPNVPFELLPQPHTEHEEPSSSGAQVPCWPPNRTPQRPQRSAQVASVARLSVQCQQSRAELCAHLFLSSQIYAAVPKRPWETIYC